MPDEGSLKRLGGGRWETRDGRFAIEPQSGTWVIVDNSQTDELGLPLVRGPFPSLTAAKAAIETARSSGPAESPLAERLKRSAAGPRGTAMKGRARDATRQAARTKTDTPAAGAAPPPEPEEPPEPRWLRDLAPADRRRARELIERLAGLDVDDPEPIARAEVVRDEPAITRLAVARAIRAAIDSASTPQEAGRAVVEAIRRGRDPRLNVRWRLVDERGRVVDPPDLGD